MFQVPDRVRKGLASNRCGEDRPLLTDWLKSSPTKPTPKGHKIRPNISPKRYLSPGKTGLPQMAPQHDWPDTQLHAGPKRRGHWKESRYDLKGNSFPHFPILPLSASITAPAFMMLS